MTSMGLYQPQMMEVSFLACNLLKHTLDKVPNGSRSKLHTELHTAMLSPFVILTTPTR